MPTVYQTICSRHRRNNNWQAAVPSHDQPRDRGDAHVMAMGVEPPEADVLSHRAAPTVESAVDVNTLLRIRSSRSRPESAFCSILDADHWFFIEHDDWDTKRAFTLLQILHALQTANDQSAMPLVTIPAGG